MDTQMSSNATSRLQPLLLTHFISSFTHRSTQYFPTSRLSSLLLIMLTSPFYTKKYIIFFPYILTFNTSCWPYTLFISPFIFSQTILEAAVSPSLHYSILDISMFFYGIWGRWRGSYLISCRSYQTQKNKWGKKRENVVRVIHLKTDLFSAGSHLCDVIVMQIWLVFLVINSAIVMQI